MSLTDVTIRALKLRAVRYLLTDGRGLCLEVLPSGKQSWLYRYRLNGKPEKVTIGRYPEISLKAARTERDSLATLVSQGKSPARKKQLAKQAIAAASTLEVFAERYYREVVARRRKNPKHIRRYLDKQIFPACSPKFLQSTKLIPQPENSR